MVAVSFLLSVVIDVSTISPSCPDWRHLRYYSDIIKACSGDMISLLKGPYPWEPTPTKVLDNWTQPTKREGEQLRDPTDLLNHMCNAVYQRFCTCVSDKVGSGVPEECLVYGFSLNYFDVKRTFDFICQQKRDSGLLHSLRCLHSTRVLQSLQLEATPRFGIDLLQEQSNAMKNILFFASDMSVINEQKSAMLQRIQKGYICMADDVVDELLLPVLRKCGRRAMLFTQEYFAYYKEEFTNLWMPSNVTLRELCQAGAGIRDARSAGKPQKMPGTASALAFKDWTTLIDVGDTSINTDFGRYILSVFYGNKGARHRTEVDFAFRLLLHLQFVRTEPVRFNLFHFVHGLGVFHPYSVPCENMDPEVVRSNWTLYQLISPKARGVRYQLHVLLGGCELYEHMTEHYDHCEWEEILLKIYRQVALSSDVPATDYWLPGGAERLLLDGLYEYYDVDHWLTLVRKTLVALQMCLGEITEKCGQALTNKLTHFYETLDYTVKDSIVFTKDFNT